MASYWLPDACLPYRARIDFTGWLSQEQVAELYARADILVVPSCTSRLAWSSSRVCWTGLAILATAVGGPRGILADEENGLLCAARDPVALSDSSCALFAIRRCDSA